MVFGPSTHGEIGEIDLQIEQGLIIIYEVMRTMWTPGHGQDIQRVFLWTFQHASRLSLPLFEYSNKRAPHLEGYYYVYLRKFIAEHKIQLEFSYIDCPKPEIEDDFLIMDQVCE